MVTHGLFVGIEAYDGDSNFSSLKYACNDAKKIRKSMLNSPMGLAESDAILLTGKGDKSLVGRNKIIAKLVKVAEKAEQGDTLIFYFAGHGYYVENGGGKGLYLVTPEVERNSENRLLPHTALSVDLVLELLSESLATNILIIIDACRTTGNSVRGAAIPPDLSVESEEQLSPSNVNPSERWAIMLACEPASFAHEDDELHAGLWTYCLCEALGRHGAIGPGQTISHKDLFDSASVLLKALVGEKNLQQVPGHYSSYGNLAIPLLCNAEEVNPIESPWRDLESAIMSADKKIRIPINDFEPVSATPFKRSRRLEEKYGCNRLYFKLENLQNTGSFKYRGATNAVECVHESGEQPILVASSAGNHGLGLAVAAHHRGIDCHIFMPIATPLTKSSAVKKYTDNVHLVGSDYDACQKKAKEFAEENNALFIHPFDNHIVVAGQGTIGLELLDDWAKMKESQGFSGSPDYVIIPCGGGGLLAGVGTILSKGWPNTEIIAVEPESIPSLSVAMKENSPTLVQANPTIADGIAVREVGQHTLRCIQGFLKSENIWKVTENSMAVATLQLMEDARVIAEGAGAAPLAAMHERDGNARGCFTGKNVICLISGGNLDILSLSALVSRGLNEQHRRKKITFSVPDNPGALASITKALHDEGANIVDLRHRRYDSRIELHKAEVRVEIETHNTQHGAEILERLKANTNFEISEG